MKEETLTVENLENLNVQDFLKRHETHLKKLGLKKWLDAIKENSNINIYINDCVEIGKNGFYNNRVLKKSEKVCDSSKSLFKKLLELLWKDWVMPIILDLLQVEWFEFNGVRSLGSLALKKKDWYPKDDEIKDLLMLIEKIKEQVKKEKKEYEEVLKETEKSINYFDNSIIKLIWEYINSEEDIQEDFERKLKKEIKEKKAKSIKEQMKSVWRKASDITANRGFFWGV